MSRFISAAYLGESIAMNVNFSFRLLIRGIYGNNANCGGCGVPARSDGHTAGQPSFSGLRLCSKILVLTALNFIILAHSLCRPSLAEASDHLRPLANLHFDTNAPRTETADMSEERYEARMLSLREKVEMLYERLYLSAGPRAREPLAAAQAAWLDMAGKYDRVLRRSLNAAVKVFYGDKDKERITNIFMDNTLSIYEQRAMDLSRWIDGDAPTGAQMKPGKSLQEWKSAIRDKGAHVEYVMAERYRMDEHASRMAWEKFCDAQESFLSAFHGDGSAVRAELWLMHNRLMNLTTLQEQGAIFFHTEREE
ncbi:MAG: hypothetical protein LBS45_05335 [Synergistaceae bacterium]|jgi:hypothetical protein|nr:hypothetical protein [Synergistaceae bacterium]